MKKLVVWLVIGFFACGMFYCWLSYSISNSFYTGKYQFSSVALERELNARASERGTATVVYATRDRPKGAIFTRQDGIEIEYRRHQIPVDAVTNLDVAVGNKLAWGIRDGQMLSIHEFEPSRKGRPLWIYELMQDIPKGKTIESGDLGKSRFEVETKNKYRSVDASEFEYNPIGKKAKVALKKGTILRVQELEQN